MDRKEMCQSEVLSKLHRRSTRRPFLSCRGYTPRLRIVAQTMLLNSIRRGYLSLVDPALKLLHDVGRF
jgi:hypothetical protein